MSDLVKTIRVKPWGKDQGDFVEINADDFDESVHDLYEAAEAHPPSHGLNVAELKEALEAKGIEIPEGAKKADLAALLDAAPADESDEEAE